MDTGANGGVIINLDNDDAEKLIKIAIHHSKLNALTPRERDHHMKLMIVRSFSNKIEKLEDDLVRSCKAIRSFVKQSGGNLINSTSDSLNDDNNSF
uniref:Uncharacterized protein n=1 Tax=Strongyloides papillosus TaxID=174720 RepID=A0A0N5BGW0_STREA